jgi:hypothetical protein
MIISRTAQSQPPEDLHPAMPEPVVPPKRALHWDPFPYSARKQDIPGSGETGDRCLPLRKQRLKSGPKASTPGSGQESMHPTFQIGKPVPKPGSRQGGWQPPAGLQAVKEMESNGFFTGMNPCKMALGT